MSESDDLLGTRLTRRTLLRAAPAAVSAAALGRAPDSDPPAKDVLRGRRLTTGWEHYRGTLGGLWEVWRGEKASDNVAWRAVTLPHCFNERDSVDPDTAYYQGPGWYRTLLSAGNPYPNGRTLLQFEGAGQTTQVWVYTQPIGRHVGGYDEFALDITDAIPRVPVEYKGQLTAGSTRQPSRRPTNLTVSDIESTPSLTQMLVGGPKLHLRGARWKVL